MSRKSLVVLSSLVLLSALCVLSPAQSITTGDVTGTITDPSGASVPNATVTLTNQGTNATQKVTTSTSGTFRFGLLQPGMYSVSVTASGFQPAERRDINVAAGQPTGVNMALAVGPSTTNVTVTENVGALQTENADVKTTFRSETVLNLPNPGNDITYAAQTAPGVVMNTQAGYGNFVVDGMPGTSNLFSVNGQNYNDPFFGINNSGASNLLLGQNDIAEVNVINNPYSAQYGQYAGAQVAYITKSGTNDFHGDAVYEWNGRYLNADQFFSNSVGEPRPFNNFNQWAVGAQGPLIKDKTFFDVDYEGVRNVLPTASILTLIPSPQFQAATLANLAALGKGSETPFYNQLFSIYNNAPGARSAVPVPQNGGCQNFALLGAGVPCALEYRTTPPNLNHEYQWSARVDQNFGSNDHFYVRVLRDNGFQPTFTSPFGATFNDQSNQPQMSGQVSETHSFGPNTVNQFSGSALFYAAVFTPSSPAGALSALPTFIGFSGSPFTAAGAYGEPPFPPGFFFPQGRRVFQYQVMDDISHVMGRHTFRMGFSWLHDNITSLDFQSLGGPIYGAINTTITDFYNGGGPSTSLTQAFPSSTEQPLVFNVFGGYLADDWKVTDRVTISLNLRLENYQNPRCATSCFSRLPSQFTGAAVPDAGSIPYNQLIASNLQYAFPHTQALDWEPRVGIAWRPGHGNGTVIRLGAGVFADQIPGSLSENSAFNSPGFNSFTIGNGTLLAPGVPGSLFSTAALANQALLSQFRSGASFNSISAAVPGFAAPNFYSFPNMFYQPNYYKWNAEVQQSLGGGVVLSTSYTGNHGIHIPVADQGLNAYCPTTVCPGGFAGLPTTVPNAAFGTVYQYLSAGTSDYDGLTFQLQKQFRKGVSFNVNYTWSHAMDDVSNGGIFNLPFSILATNESVTTLQNPFNVRGNWGNADYDVRHYLSANFVLTDIFRQAGFKWGPSRIFGGWTLSTNWFLRSGLPFTIVDSSASSALAGFNYAGVIFASPTGPLNYNCSQAVNTPCLTTSEFAPAANGAPTGFGTIGRNSVYGPHFFDLDMALMKDVKITEKLTFSFGAQAFNLLNHTNFDQPVADISNPQFGSTIAAVGPPTSLLGSFVGAGSSPRFVEIKGMLRF